MFTLFYERTEVRRCYSRLHCVIVGYIVIVGLVINVAYYISGGCLAHRAFAVQSLKKLVDNIYLTHKYINLALDSFKMLLASCA